jgi:hypothetical protein
MKRLLIAAALAAGLAGLAAAQTPDDFKTFVSQYIAVFNKGDAAGLAKDFYAAPDAKAKLDAEYAKLRGDEWGKMNLFGVKSCLRDPTHADVEVAFEQQYTYGGQMPPGDQSTVLKLVKTDGGWRIASGVELAPGQLGACP